MKDRYIARNDGVALPPFNFCNYGVTRHFVQDRETGENVTATILKELLPEGHPMLGTRYVSEDQAIFLARIARNPDRLAPLIALARERFARQMGEGVLV